MRVATGSMLVLAALACGGRAMQAGEIDVVATIKPVHSLVAGVMQGVGAPVLLIRGTGSEHSYSLRPSQVRALDGADVVFWVGETLETFLIKPLRAFAGDARIVELSKAPGLVLLATREGGMWEAHEHGTGHADANGEGENADADPVAENHAHGEIDMHVWLDPTNAKALVATIARALGDADPQNASAYRANAARLQKQLAALDRSLEHRLATIADRPYVVFHDAYQYFEHRYGVAAVGAITINPTLRPGARRLREIQERLEHLEAACIFAEPQFEPALVDTLIEGTSASKGVLDPLGVELEPGTDQYLQMMEGMAAALVDCLGTARSG